MKLKKNIKLLIAADGGAGSGKTTGSKLISKKYGLKLLTSGLLYRFVAFKLLKNKKIKSKNLFLKKITKNITPKNLDNINLFSKEVTEHAFKIAKVKKIRNLLKNCNLKIPDSDKFNDQGIVDVAPAEDKTSQMAPTPKISFVLTFTDNLSSKFVYFFSSFIFFNFLRRRF